MRWRSSHPDSGFFMRSFHLVRTIIVPKFRFLSAGLAALALAACEMQPVVTAPAAPAKSETATEIAAPVATPAVKATAETAGAAPEGVPAIDPDSGPADATTDSSGDATEDVAGEDVAGEDVPGGDMSADTGEADSGTAADSLRASMTATAVEAEPAPDKADDTDDPASEPVAETQPESLPTSDDAGNEDTIGDAIASDETAVTDLALLAPPPPPPAELVPSSLVGFSPEQLRARLGEADFTRQEGDMKTWQYRLSDCVVDYFLFPQEGVIRVASWAWRAPVIGLDIDAVACRRALAERDTDSGG